MNIRIKQATAYRWNYTDEFTFIIEVDSKRTSYKYKSGGEVPYISKNSFEGTITGLPESVQPFEYKGTV